MHRIAVANQPQLCPSSMVQPSNPQFLSPHSHSQTTPERSPSVSPRSRLKNFSIPPIHTNMSFGGFLKRRSPRQTQSPSPVNFFTRIKHKISSTSPDSEKPKTWDHYVDAYAQGQLDIEDPPLPPLSAQLNPDGPFQAQFFPAPLPQSESSRQTVLNRLGYYEAPLARHPNSCSSFSADSPSFPDSPPSTLSAFSSVSSSLNCFQDLSLKSRLSPPTAAGPMPDLQSALLTLVEHPAFHKITARCVALLSAKASRVTVIDDDRVVFLAETGNSGIASVHRELAFCSHTILNSNRPFTVPDAAADWRFANHPSTLDGTLRSYAGAPIFAPHLPGLIHSPPEDPVCIGTLCVVDGRPRPCFTQDERTALVRLAGECREVISEWFIQKVQRKLEGLDNISLSTWLPSPQPSNAQLQLSPGHPSNFLNASSSTSSSPQELSFCSSGGQKMAFVAHNSVPYKLEKRTRPRAQPSPSLITPLENCLTPFQSLSPERAAKFDLATKLLAETLELSTVYLVAVMPSGFSLPSEAGHTSGNSSRPQTPRKRAGHILVISSYNIPVPAPPLDYELHRKAIRNGPKGLVFQNPPLRPSSRPKSRPSSAVARDEREADWQEIQDFAFDRAYDTRLRARRKRLSTASSNPNKSGILLCIGAERQMCQLSGSLQSPTPPPNITSADNITSSPMAIGGNSDGSGAGGFVLAGYSHDPKRVLGLDDMSYFKHFSNQLVKDIDDLFETHCLPLPTM